MEEATKTEVSTVFEKVAAHDAMMMVNIAVMPPKIVPVGPIVQMPIVSIAKVVAAVIVEVLSMPHIIAITPS